MTEIAIHLSNGHVQDIHFDGEKQGVAIDAFLLLTSVPTDPPASHVLAYGNSDKVGGLLYNFWKHSVALNPEGAWVIEQAARAIVKATDEARGGEWPPGPGAVM